MSEQASNKPHSMPEVIKTLDGKSWDQLPQGTIARSGRNRIYYRKEKGFEGKEVEWNAELQKWESTGRNEIVQLMDGQGWEVLHLPTAEELQQQTIDNIKICVGKPQGLTEETLQQLLQMGAKTSASLNALLGRSPDEETPISPNMFLVPTTFREAPNGALILVQRGNVLHLFKKNGTEIVQELAGNATVTRFHTSMLKPDTEVYLIREPGSMAA